MTDEAVGTSDSTSPVNSVSALVGSAIKTLLDGLRIAVSSREYADFRAEIERGEVPWGVGAFLYFSKFLDEERCYLDLTIKGMELLTTVSALWEKDHPERLQEKAVDLAIAKEETRKGFPRLYAHHLVSLWNMIDATLSDSLVQLFVAQPQTVAIPRAKKIKFTVAHYEKMNRIQLIRAVVAELKREYSSQERVNKGIRIYQEIYREIGIDIPLSDSNNRNLVELRANRNAIVHNMGIVDDRLVNDCPWLQLRVGAPVVISPTCYERLRDSASQYLVDVLAATWSSIKPARPSTQSESAAPTNTDGAS